MNPKESFNLWLKAGAYACLEFLNNVWRTWDYGDETTQVFCFWVKEILLLKCAGTARVQSDFCCQKGWNRKKALQTHCSRRLRRNCLYMLSKYKVQMNLRYGTELGWLAFPHTVVLIMIPHSAPQSMMPANKGESEFISGWATSECHSKISCDLTALDESLMFLPKLSKTEEMASLTLLMLTLPRLPERPSKSPSCSHHLTRATQQTTKQAKESTAAVCGPAELTSSAAEGLTNYDLMTG